MSTNRRRIGVHADHESYKWWALSCTSLGMLLVTLNSGTLIIALPNLERELHVDLLELVWVILAYMIASTVLVLTAGRLSDIFGRKRAYLLAFVVFGIGSLGAGFANSGAELILWRILQGIGGAFLFANAPAIVTDAFPSQQLGVAMGTNTMIAAVGLALGPVLGGALVAIGWQWVFWFNVPVAIIGGVWGALILHDRSGRDPERGLDPLGTVTFLVGLTGLVYAISRGGLSGWGDGWVIAGFIAGGILLPLFVFIEAHQTGPLLDLSLFRSRLFSAACAAAFVNGLARFALTFIFVFYFQGPQGDDAIVAGLKLIPLAAGMLVSSPLAGIIADRSGSRILASLGMVVTAAALALMTTLQVDSPYWQSATWLALVGIGSGLFNSPNTAAMMGSVPSNRRGVASGARVLVTNSGAVISIAFVLAVVTSSIPRNVLFSIFSGVTKGLSSTQLAPFMNNMHFALWILAAVSMAGAAICLLRPSESEHRSAQPYSQPA